MAATHVGNDVRLELVRAKGILELVPRGVRDGLDVDFDGL